MSKDKDPIDELRQSMEAKLTEFRVLLSVMDSVSSKQDEPGKKRIASSLTPVIGELHNLAERLTDRVVDCRG